MNLTNKESLQERKRLYDKAYRLKNKAKIKQAKQEWYKAHQDTLLEKSRMLSGTEEFKAKKRAYYSANKDKFNSWRKNYLSTEEGFLVKKTCNANYRCKLQKKISSFYRKEIREIYKNCPEGFHVDHIVPLNHPLMTGLHVPWNLQYLPAQENIKKSNKIKDLK